MQYDGNHLTYFCPIVILLVTLEETVFVVRTAPVTFWDWTRPIYSNCLKKIVLQVGANQKLGKCSTSTGCKQFASVILTYTVVIGRLSYFRVTKAPGEALVRIASGWPTTGQWQTSIPGSAQFYAIKHIQYIYGKCECGSIVNLNFSLPHGWVQMKIRRAQ